MAVNLIYLWALFLRIPFCVSFQVRAEQRRTSWEGLRYSKGQRQRGLPCPHCHPGCILFVARLSDPLMNFGPRFTMWCLSVDKHSPYLVWENRKYFPFLHHPPQESNSPKVEVGDPVSLAWITCLPWRQDPNSSTRVIARWETGDFSKRKSRLRKARMDTHRPKQPPPQMSTVYF